MNHRNYTNRLRAIACLLAILLFIAWRLSNAESFPHFIASYPFTIAYSCWIVLFGLWAYLPLSQKMKSANKLMSDGAKQIEAMPDLKGFALEFRTLDNWVNEQPALRHLWGEYKETLIHPDPADESRPSVIRNTEDAYTHFNEHSLLGADINMRFYGAMPNLLTGLGILGTFIGLMMGIHLAKSGLQSEDPILMKQALDDLLSGASLAFITSIAGMASSMSFSGIEKRLSHRFQDALSRWNRALDTRVERVTPENLGTEQLKQLELQTAHMEAFVTDVATNIAEAMGQQMDNTLTPVLERLIATIEDMRKDRAENDEKMLREIVDTFANTLKESAGKEMEALSSTLNDMNTSLVPLIDQMTEAQNEMRGAAKFISETIGQSCEQGTEVLKQGIQTAVTNLEKGIADASEQLTSKIGDTFDNAVDKLNETLNGFNAVAEGISSTYEKSSQKFSQGVEDAMDKLMAGIDKVSDQITTKLAETFERAVDRLNQSASLLDKNMLQLAEASKDTESMISGVKELITQFNQSADILSELQDKAIVTVDSLKGTAQAIKDGGANVSTALKATQSANEDLSNVSKSMLEAHNVTTELWKAYSKRFKDLDDSLEKTFAAITDHLSSYGELMNGYIAEIDKQTAGIVKTFSGAISEFGESTEDIAENIGHLDATIEKITAALASRPPQAARQDDFPTATTAINS